MTARMVRDAFTAPLLKFMHIAHTEIASKSKISMLVSKYPGVCVFSEYFPAPTFAQVEAKRSRAAADGSDTN